MLVGEEAKVKADKSNVVGHDQRVVRYSMHDQALDPPLSNLDVLAFAHGVPVSAADDWSLPLVGHRRKW